MLPGRPTVQGLYCRHQDVAYRYLIPVTGAYKSSSTILPQRLVGYWRLRLFNASSPKSVGGLMYNYWRGCAENIGNEYLALNQVVGGSNPSGRAIIFKHLGHLTKSRVSRKCLTSKVVIDSWGPI